MKGGQDHQERGEERGGGEWARLTGRDTLDASTTRETADGGLGDALDVVTENLAVTLRSAFAEAFATFSAWEGMLVDTWRS